MARDMDITVRHNENGSKTYYGPCYRVMYRPGPAGERIISLSMSQQLAFAVEQNSPCTVCGFKVALMMALGYLLTAEHEVHMELTIHPLTKATEVHFDRPEEKKNS